MPFSHACPPGIVSRRPDATAARPFAAMHVLSRTPLLRRQRTRYRRRGIAGPPLYEPLQREPGRGITIAIGDKGYALDVIANQHRHAVAQIQIVADGQKRPSTVRILVQRLGRVVRSLVGGAVRQRAARRCPGDEVAIAGVGAFDGLEGLGLGTGADRAVAEDVAPTVARASRPKLIP